MCVETNEPLLKEWSKNIIVLIYVNILIWDLLLIPVCDILCNMVE